MIFISIIVVIILIISMLKSKLSKRQKDRKLKKAVEEHLNEIKQHQSNLHKNGQPGTSDVDISGIPEIISMYDSSEEMYDSSEDDYYPSSSSISDSDSDYSDLDDSDFEISIEVPSTKKLDPQIKPCLADELKICFIKHGVTHKCVNDLLEILRKHHDLPKDARTLLGTPVTIATKNLADGQYIHFGIRCGLEHLKSHLESLVIRLSFNIDGLPLFKSSSQQIWPILCLVNNISQSRPFVIGIFCGNSKPTNVSAYLQDFINDLKELLANPVIGGKLL